MENESINEWNTGSVAHCKAWIFVQIFRKALVKMFQEQDLDCVFLETHMNPKRRLHMVYECIPLPRELGDMAPIYFKVRPSSGVFRAAPGFLMSR